MRLLLTCLVLMSACRKEPPAQPDAAEAVVDATLPDVSPEPAPSGPGDAVAPAAAGDASAAALPGETAQTGNVIVSAVLEGKAPAMPELDRSSDPFCGATAAVAPWVRANARGALADVLVRLPVGAAKGAGPESTRAANVTVNQERCMYLPYVSGVQAGGTVQVKNADRVLHNVHTTVGGETVFNLAQTAGGDPIVWKAGKEEVSPGDVVRLGCDIHKWMLGHVVVTDHPYFGVSGEDGKVSLKDVPAGKYAIEAWHPHLGVQKVSVTVEPGQTAEARVSFAASAYRAPEVK